MFSDKWWNSNNGAIFFYAGNEAPITYFWNNCGFIFDIAPKFNALVVFAEHVSMLLLLIYTTTLSYVFCVKTQQGRDRTCYKEAA